MKRKTKFSSTPKRAKKQDGGELFGEKLPLPLASEMWEPNFDRHPLNEIEAALESLEISWADFLYGARRGRRYIRDEHRPAALTRTFATVHRILDSYRQQHVGGDRLAIWTALICCIQENVPLPYWLGNAILEIHEKVNREPSNLHELFGMRLKLPSQGKRSRTNRRDLQWRARLWSAASELMAEAKAGKKKMSKDAAIKQARKQLDFPYSQRKSREMFDVQERIQSAYFDAWEGRKKHHIK